MPFETSATSPQLLAQILGTLTLRTGAAATFTFGAELAIEKRESCGAGTILYADEVREALRWDFPAETASSFLRSLASGLLSDYRYDLSEERLQTPQGPLPFPREELIRRQDALDPALRRAPETRKAADVRLTVPGAFLENIATLPAIAFYEAAYRALGFRQAETMDLLWMHAGDGELRFHDVTAPIVLGLQPPPNVSLATYREFPDRFPLVCLQFDRSQWKIQARHVIGRHETRDRLLALLDRAAWGLWIDTGERRKKSVREALVGLIRGSAPPETPEVAPEPVEEPPVIPPPPRVPKIPRAPKAVRATPPPAVAKRPPYVSDIFFRPEAEIIRKGSPGIVAITGIEIPVEALSEVAKRYFHQAVRLCLGVREPREGDRVFLTSGESFSKKGKIRDCLFVTPEIPETRKSVAYPKVGLEYRSRRWVVLPKTLRGHGHQDLFRAVTGLTDWGIVLPSEDDE